MENYKLFVRSMKVMGKKMYLYLGAIFVMSVSFAMFSIMTSLLMKSVVDIAQTGEYQRLAVTIVVIVVVGLVSLLIYRVATIRYNVEAKRVYGVLSEAVLDAEMNLPYSYYEKHHSGEIISKVSYDLTKMGDIYGSRLRRVVMPFLQVVAFLIPMLLMSWQLTLCLIAVNAVMMGIEMLLLNPMHRVSKELSGINTKMTSRLSDLLQGMEQARMYESGHRTVEDFKIQNHAYSKKYNKKLLYTACLECSGKGFELLCSLVFLVLGIYFVNKGYTTLGALTAIYTMYGSFSFQFLQMGKYIPELVGCLANAKNIFDFLDEAREPKNWYTDKVDEGKDMGEEKAIEIEKISFSYHEEAEVLKDFSLDIKRGECIAITGASGCGKTTLSKLLLGLYPLNGGTIRVNGLDIRKCSLTELRKQISYVPQEPYLFHGSIMDNIRMGRPEASEEEIIEAAKMANAHEFIMGFAEGYDTKVGERGNNLSGGQRQRIAIARAILKEAQLILMDEATSALDNESEQLVNDALRKMHGKKTIVMIAHRPSTVQLADRVCQM
ncbi:MAG: ATP-binding cassette domain-containing protein [Lachnospiraceae bacterium]|nr:ATP-binding cassette domain-containing protein [Lachnospiraceae bacterium]